MATLPVTTLARTGIDVATGTAAAGGGDQFPNTGKELLAIVNGSGGSITVTVATQAQVDGQAVADQTIAIGAGVTKLIGPFPIGYYNDTLNMVQLTYSGVTSLTVLPLVMYAGA